MTCKDCVHDKVCREYLRAFWGHVPNKHSDLINAKPEDCPYFKARSRFVELNIAKKIKHTPYIDKMREFPKLGLVTGMSERSIFWTCSKCELWVSLAHNFCPNCGAKFEAEQAWKGRENNG